MSDRKEYSIRANGEVIVFNGVAYTLDDDIDIEERRYVDKETDYICISITGCAPAHDNDGNTVEIDYDWHFFDEDDVKIDVNDPIGILTVEDD